MASSRRGKLIVLSAPSGTGKSTVCRELLAAHTDVAVSISYTTRAPRGSEQDGRHYHFVDDATFDRMVTEGEFLEWAEVHGKRYGSGRAETERLRSGGKDVLFDIDVQGGRQIKRSDPGAVLIFLLPPSMEELVRRLKKRGTETEDQVRARLRAAKWELEQGIDYDVHVINDSLHQAVQTVDRIRREPQREHDRHVELLRELASQAGRLSR